MQLEYHRRAKMQLEIVGDKLRLGKEKEKYEFLQKTTHYVFRLNSLESPNGSPDSKETPVECEPNYKTTANIKLKKAQVNEVSFESAGIKYSPDDRQTVSVNKQVYPSYSISIDLCKHRNQAMEDIKNEILNISSNHKESSPNLSSLELDNYLSSAYEDLYGQYLKGTNEISFGLSTASNLTLRR